MVDDRNSIGGFSAIRGRKKIPFNELNTFASFEPAERFLETINSTRGANKATEIGKIVFEKRVNDLSTDKTAGSCYQDAILPGGNTFKIHRGLDLRNQFCKL